MTTNTVIRAADSEDVPGLASLINMAFAYAEEFFIDGDRVSQPEVETLLKSGTFLISENEGRIIGCVYLEPRGDRCYLGLLSVDPKAQGMGVGSALMRASEQLCREIAVRHIDLKIVNLRVELPAFYARRGYSRTGTSPFPVDVETKLPCHFIEMTKTLQ